MLQRPPRSLAVVLVSAIAVAALVNWQARDLVSPNAPAALDMSPADPAALKLLAQGAPTAHVMSAIAVDIDRDGDLDVVGTTSDAALAVWVNTGHGQLVRNRVPARRPWQWTSSSSVTDSSSHSPGQITPVRVGADTELVPVRMHVAPNSQARAPGLNHAVLQVRLISPRLGRAPPSAVVS